MGLSHALEGIDQEDVRNRLKSRIDDILDADDEKTFWIFRTRLLAKFNIPDPLLSAGSYPPSDMPLFLAYAWKQYIEEHHPRVRLHLMMEFVELSIRFSVAVLISQIRSHNSDQLPEDLASKLSQLIRSPTLGQWLAMLRELSAHSSANSPLPRLFNLYAALNPNHWLSNKDSISEDGSILVLRNHVSHGGGFSNQKASEWVDAHKDRVEGMLNNILEALDDAKFVSADKSLLLMGEVPSEVELHDLTEDASGCWMLLDGEAMPLWPMADYSPVSRFDQNGQLQTESDEYSSQIYASLNKKSLNFTPVGNDACVSQHPGIEQFRQLFRLEEGLKKRVDSAYQWNDFIVDAREESKKMVGRMKQLDAMKGWVKARDSQVTTALWIHGKPGMGKSMLVSRAVADWANGANGDKSNGLYYHRFRAGDGRNNWRMFMKLLQQGLWEWKLLQEVTEKPNSLLEGDKLMEDIQGRLGFLGGLQTKHEKGATPRYLLVVDGLDEVASYEPKLLESLKALMLPGVVLVVSSRNEQGLGDHLLQLGVDELFSEGLPRLDANEVRAMLEMELTSKNLLKKLVQSDSENTPTDVIPENRYVQKVLKHSEGLPLYIHFLIEDLKLGKRELDGDELPDSLRAYYNEIMDRIGLSRVKHDLTEIIAVLAVAKEPLERDALAQMLADHDSDWQSYCGKVDVALEVGSSLLRLDKTGDNSSGYTLYHQSYREHLLSGESPLEDLPYELLKKRLLTPTERWATFPEGKFRNHLFRYGIDYSLVVGGQHLIKACDRLCDFDYLMAYMKALDVKYIPKLLESYSSIVEHIPQKSTAKYNLSLWNSFLKSNLHRLLLGNATWSANKILLQLAVEYSGSIAIAAEKWLETGRCNWIWMRASHSGNATIIDDSIRTIEGIKRFEVQQDENTLLTISKSDEFQVWDLETLDLLRASHLNGEDENLMSLDGSKQQWIRESRPVDLPYSKKGGSIFGEDNLENGRVITCTGSHAKYCDSNSKQCLHEFHGPGVINNVDVQNNGKWALISLDIPKKTLGFIKTKGVWGGTNTRSSLFLWNLITGKSVRITNRKNNVWLHPDGQRLLSYGDESDFSLWGVFRLWDVDTLSSKKLLGHKMKVSSVLFHPDGNTFYSCSHDRTVRVWDMNACKKTIVLEGLPISASAIRYYPEDQIIVTFSAVFSRSNEEAKLRGYSNDDQGYVDKLLFWNANNYEFVTEFKFQTYAFLPEDIDIAFGAKKIITHQNGSLKVWAIKNSFTSSSKNTFFRNEINSKIMGIQTLNNGNTIAYSSKKIFILDDKTSPGVTHYEWEIPEEDMILELLANGDILLFDRKTILVWDGQTGETVKSAKTPGRYQEDFQLSKAKKRFITYSNHRLILWEASSLDRLCTIKERDIQFAYLNESETKIVFFLGGGVIKVWAIGNKKTGLWNKSLTRRLMCVQIDNVDCFYGISVIENQSRNQILIRLNSGMILFLEILSGRITSLDGDSSGHPVIDAIILNEEEKLLTSHQDTTIRLWSYRNHMCQRIFSGHRSFVEGLVVFNNKKSLMSYSSGDSSIRIWNIDSGSCLQTIDTSPVGGISYSPAGIFSRDSETNVVLSPDETKVLSRSKDKRVINLWDIESGELLQSASCLDEEKTLLQMAGFFASPGWQESVTMNNGVGLISGDHCVCWIGDEAKIVASATLDSIWVFYLANQVECIQLWEGNQRLDTHKVNQCCYSIRRSPFNEVATTNWTAS